MLPDRRFRMEVITDEDAAMLHRLGGAARLRLIDKLNRASRALTRSRVRSDHPDWSRELCESEVNRRWLENGTL